MFVSFFALIPATEIQFFSTTSSSDTEVEAEIAQIPSHISVILQNKIDKADPSRADGGGGLIVPSLPPDVSDGGLLYKSTVPLTAFYGCWPVSQDGV